MRRNWSLWFAFSLCLGVVLAAMAWISVTAMRLDEAETRARRQAALEENVRLALWRIDSALSPILAQESAMPYIAYNTFVPPAGTAVQTPSRGANSGELAAAPLSMAPYLLIRFQFEPDGRLTSPSLPSSSASVLGGEGQRPSSRSGSVPGGAGQVLPSPSGRGAGGEGGSQSMAANGNRLGPIAPQPAPLPENQPAKLARQQLDRIRALTDRSRLAELLPRSPSAPRRSSSRCPIPPSKTARPPLAPKWRAWTAVPSSLTFAARR